MGKRSICKCSNTPEARNFTSKGQVHVHCPCEKCEDRAVYPMVAWRHMRKRIRYSDANVDDPDGVELDIAATSIQLSSNEEITSPSKTSVSNDCFHVSPSYTEFDDSSSPLLLAAARDDDETDESVVLDTVSSHSGDVVNSESFSDEGSESDPATISDRAEEQGNGMIDFFREAVLRLVEIKGTVGFSIKTFEDLLKWGANLHCENNEEAQSLWPSSWEDVQTLLGDIGFQMPKLYYICLDASHPSLYALLESRTDVCPRCGKQGTIPYYYLSVQDKVKR